MIIYFLLTVIVILMVMIFRAIVTVTRNQGVIAQQLGHIIRELRK